MSSFKPGSNPSARQEPEDDPKADDAKRSSGGQDSQGHRSSESSTARRRASKAGQRSESAIGDFEGDYGNYLQLLEGDSALGFNPQSDPIGDNQVPTSSTSSYLKEYFIFNLESSIVKLFACFLHLNRSI